jgi:hypothetical protein
VISTCCGITSTECDVNTHKLTLLTFNIEGLAGNFSYLTMLACRADFMLLQEHWLHNCDKNRLQEFLPDFNCYSKCHDDNVASDPIERRRGKEGVAICVKQKYSHLIEPQALEFRTPLFSHLVPPAKSGSISLSHLSICYNISCYNSLVLLTFVSRSSCRFT